MRARIRRQGGWFVFAVLGVALMCAAAAGGGETLELRARHRPADANTPVAFRQLQWQPEQTALIVCDMWDKHWCKSATARVAELAPHIDAFCKAARKMGVTIVHAPSDCMKHYEDSPARLRMTKPAPDANMPKGMGQWLASLPGEPALPIDASDGGCPDEPQCRTYSAWTRQIETISIDQDKDFISDRGEEIWRLFESRGIRNIVLVGVHANMCVLGRPFGLRQWARIGKNVVLVRDLTDTMYNPRRKPNISHFRGTDLLVNHVERYVCPTITSDQLLGGRAFHFEADHRRDLLIISAEDEYKTSRTLPEFAEQYLGDAFRIHYAIGEPARTTDIPGIEQLSYADVAMLAIRRRPLPPGRMAVVRKYIAAGKPLVALRTASHAFGPRKGEDEKALEQWEDFDSQILGVHYTGHYGNARPDSPPTLVWVEPGMKSHPVVAGIPAGKLTVRSWLYKCSPVSPGTEVLMSGAVAGQSELQPVTVARTTSAGGRVVYTSLGHPEDFKLDWFNRMLVQAVDWACQKHQQAETTTNPG